MLHFLVVSLGHMLYHFRNKRVHKKIKILDMIPATLHDSSQYKIKDIEILTFIAKIIKRRL